jgi:hydroxyethylthiazole kinase-like uncharacterized protein yjeF
MPSLALYRAADLRRIETAAADQPLMQRAGRAAADLAQELCGDRSGSIVVFAGPGNNGGDAFEAARLLRQRFFEVRVIFIGKPDALPKDAAAAYRRFVDEGGSTQPAPDAGERCALVVDGLFGIGLAREIGGPYAELIDRANGLAQMHRCPLLALDCPTGLDADTGKTQRTVIRASHTITFIAAKPGLYTNDGPDCCGEISVAALDLDTANIAPAPGRTIARELFSAQLKPRALNSHKGRYGDAGIVGGAPGMVGAALLAGRAALKLGSGRVYVGLIDYRALAVDPVQPELMLRKSAELFKLKPTALACGPGLGQVAAARDALASACALALPLVLDADALNLVAADGALQAMLASRSAPTLLTPHPAEAARLAASDVASVQADRVAVALELAARFKAFVALKGCGTIVATPAGEWFLNTSGNPGLATAGSGDVLTGFITALLAQGWPPCEALLAAVYLHGLAADRLVARGVGPVGLAAGELIDSARSVFNDWLSLNGF